MTAKMMLVSNFEKPNPFSPDVKVYYNGLTNIQVVEANGGYIARPIDANPYENMGGLAFDGRFDGEWLPTLDAVAERFSTCYVITKTKVPAEYVREHIETFAHRHRFMPDHSFKKKMYDAYSEREAVRYLNHKAESIYDFRRAVSFDNVVYCPIASDAEHIELYSEHMPEFSDLDSHYSVTIYHAKPIDEDSRRAQEFRKNEDAERRIVSAIDGAEPVAIYRSLICATIWFTLDSRLYTVSERSDHGFEWEVYDCSTGHYASLMGECSKELEDVEDRFYGEENDDFDEAIVSRACELAQSKVDLLKAMTYAVVDVDGDNLKAYSNGEVTSCDPYEDFHDKGDFATFRTYPNEDCRDEVRHLFDEGNVRYYDTRHTHDGGKTWKRCQRKAVFIPQD